MIRRLTRLLIALSVSVALLVVPTVASSYQYVSPYLEEFNEKWAQEAPQRAERAAAERRAVAEAEEARRVGEAENARRVIEAREAAERELRESAQQAESAERETKLLAEQTAARHALETAAAVKCVVPLLTGDTLASARRSLDHSHCQLGHVTGSRGGQGSFVVIGQSVRGGRRLASGSAIAVHVGLKSRRP